MRTIGYLAYDGIVYSTKEEMLAVNVQLALQGAQLNTLDRQEKAIKKANAKRVKALKRNK